MTTHTCDLPGCTGSSNRPLQIQLSGYYPNNASGLLLPETAKEFQFCSHACFVKWMSWALAHEIKPGYPDPKDCSQAADMVRRGH